MPITIEQLRAALPGLESVSERVARQIAQASTLRNYAPRKPLYRAGDAVDGLYLVLSGRVLVLRDVGSRSQMLHTEITGGVLGEIPVFGGGPFPATATALDRTQCVHVPLAVIDRLLASEPSFARFALRRMAMRARSLLARIDDLTASTITARLAAFIDDRAAKSLTPQFTLGITQAQLASELGTAREVVVRGLATLVASGAIERAGRSRFAIRRLATLRSIAGR